jgi:hypothetical protein
VATKLAASQEELSSISDDDYDYETMLTDYPSIFKIKEYIFATFNFRY